MHRTDASTGAYFLSNSLPQPKENICHNYTIIVLDLLIWHASLYIDTYTLTYWLTHSHTSHPLTHPHTSQPSHTPIPLTPSHTPIPHIPSHMQSFSHDIGLHIYYYYTRKYLYKQGATCSAKIWRGGGRGNPTWNIRESTFVGGPPSIPSQGEKILLSMKILGDSQLLWQNLLNTKFSFATRLIFS